MPSYPEINLYIDGKWRAGDNTLPVTNPATEQQIGRLPVAGATELDDALAAAQKGFKVWSRTPPVERSRIR